jgi:hypothetical protein
MDGTKTHADLGRWMLRILGLAASSRSITTFSHSALDNGNVYPYIGYRRDLVAVIANIFTQKEVGFCYHYSSVSSMKIIHT